MQFTTTFSFATLFAIAASVVSAESPAFAIMNTRSATKFHYTGWGYDSEGKVVISTLSPGSTEFKALYVEDNTSVKTSDGKYFVVNDDKSISLGDSSAAATGFSIGEKEGALTAFNLNGENGFVSCPDANGNYILYTGNPANLNDQCSGVASWAIELSGETVSSLSLSTSHPIITTPSYKNSTTVTKSDITTTVVTITSCSDDKCTSYTTTCPVTSVPTTVATSTPITAHNSTSSLSTFEGAAVGKAAAGSFAALGALAVALVL